MKRATSRLWAGQDRHSGDRAKLFGAVADAFPIDTVLYPGSYVDIAASFVFPSVTYVDNDPRAAAFFADTGGVNEIIARQAGPRAEHSVRFIHADYEGDLGLHHCSFDLLVSLYAGFVSEHCTRYLRVGGWLLVNSSHGDAALASIDARYVLEAVITSRSGAYRVEADNVDGFMVKKTPMVLTPELLHQRGRGVAYTKPASAYVFRRHK